MSSAKVNCRFWYDLEQKSAVHLLHVTPSERKWFGAFGYKHYTPPEWKDHFCKRLFSLSVLLKLALLRSGPTS